VGGIAAAALIADYLPPYHVKVVHRGKLTTKTRLLRSIGHIRFLANSYNVFSKPLRLQTAD